MWVVKPRNELDLKRDRTRRRKDPEGDQKGVEIRRRVVLIYSVIDGQFLGCVPGAVDGA